MVFLFFMKHQQPIGIFDSGVGGLSVWKEIQKLLPGEDLIYLADSMNCPYGSKSPEEIIALSEKNTRFLLAKGCKLIVVACNTATASAIDYLRVNFPVPFVGMEPAIKPAAMNTSTGKIGVLATKGTFEGRLFKETSKKYTAGINTIIQVGEGLVELVESNQFESEAAFELIKKHIQPMVDAGADQIVLGCTHYPFLLPVIEKIVPPTIQIVDPAPAVALRVKNLLIEERISNDRNQGLWQFYTTGDKATLQILLKRITGNELLVSVLGL